MSEQEMKFQEKKVATPEDEATKNQLSFAPHVDIFETEQEVSVVADIPGVTIEGVELSLENNILTIQGRRLAANRPAGRLILEEYECGDYLRRFTVAETIDQEKIEATLADGVLKVRLPKAVPTQPKKIEVRIG